MSSKLIRRAYDLSDFTRAQTMIALEKLLDEVSRDKPSGEDFEARKGAKGGEDSGELNPLEQLQEQIKSTPSADKDWKSITNSAGELLKQTKDLRVVAIYCLGLLKTSQLSGFKDGLSLLHALLKKYWDNLYPALRDGNATRRVNVLNSFSLPAHQSNVTFDFVRTLRQTPLARPARGAPITLNDILASEKPPGKEGEKANAPTAAAIQEAFAATEPAVLSQTRELLAGITSELEGIQEFLGGKEARPNFSSLQETIKEMKERVEEHVKTETPASPQPAAANPAPGKSDSSVPYKNGHDGIKSLDEVVQVLGEICKYYEINDRSSPVPLLLKRVQRMAKMNFYEIMEDLTPEEIAKLKSGPKE
jgi:type VI secretion system protein ImpA